MKRSFLIAIMAFSLIASLPAFAQSSITLRPDSANGKDALLHGLNIKQNVNYGTDPQVSAIASTFNGTPGVIRGLLEFDLSAVPANTKVDSAFLSLYAWDSPTLSLRQHMTRGGSNATWIRRVTGPWNENTVTWNTAPSFTTSKQTDLPASTSPDQNYENIDVSELVKDMITYPQTSHGFMLQLKTENYYRGLNFCSSDHTVDSLRPKLVLFYSPKDTSTVITLKPNDADGKDALLHGLTSHQSTNFGNDPQFAAVASTFNSTPGIIRSVVEFNLSSVPSNLVIDSVHLSLYAWDSPNTALRQHRNSSGSNAAWVRRVTSPWEEDSVTWLTAPSFDTTNQVSMSTSTSPTQNYGKNRCHPNLFGYD